VIPERFRLHFTSIVLQLFTTEKVSRLSNGTMTVTAWHCPALRSQRKCSWNFRNVHQVEWMMVVHKGKRACL